MVQNQLSKSGHASVCRQIPRKRFRKEQGTQGGPRSFYWKCNSTEDAEWVSLPSRSLAASDTILALQKHPNEGFAGITFARSRVIGITIQPFQSRSKILWHFAKSPDIALSLRTATCSLAAFGVTHFKYKDQV